MFINVIDWKECGEYITIKVKKSNDLTKNYKKNGGNIKGKKILTGLLNEVVIASANPIVTRPMTKPVKFVIYNTTKQETEGEVTVENGKLPDLSLVNNNNYMIYAQDEEYRTPILYIWVKEGKIYNIKKISQGSDNQTVYDYPEVDELRMYKRDPNKVYDKLENDMRVGVSLPVYYKEGTGLLKNVNIKATDGSGIKKTIKIKIK